MQRWIVAGVAAVLLVLAGAAFAYKAYQANRPAPVWVPLPVRADLPLAERDKAVEDLKKRVHDRELLLAVSREVGLPGQWGLANDEQAADEIARRLFVKPGEADSPMGKVPSINVGISGKNKERALSERIIMRMMDDVFPALGLPAPPKKDS